MADEKILFAHTKLSTDEIYAVLFKDIDVEIDEEFPELITGNEFSCVVSHNAPDAIKSEFLGETENLDIGFQFRASMTGYINSIRVVLNWLKATDADTVLAHNYEYILFSRIRGRLIRNVHPVAEIPGEILNLIDIPYEEENLGFE